MLIYIYRGSMLPGFYAIENGSENWLKSQVNARYHRTRDTIGSDYANRSMSLVMMPLVIIDMDVND